jgi:Na+(H+)/acetate symporter ActP
MSYSWGALSGCFLAPFLYGVRWKGMTKAGAWSGFAVGLGITVPLMILNAIGGILPPWMSPPAIGAIAMIASLIITPVVSVLSKKFSEEHVKSVFEDTQEAVQA